MTNPTSNFNWQMPTPTDLVTDLPADFEVFGQAVDTSMADLLGGTTGQILAKASNTNMDFAWITNDVGDITAVNVTAPITGGGSSGAVTIGVSAASTAAAGVVQLSDSTSTTSSTLASTPTATKSAYDLADAAIAKSVVTTAGDIIYRDGSAPVRLGIGTAAQVLTVNSGATAPEWSTLPTIPTIKTVRKVADQSVTSSTAVANDTHLKFAVAANETYLFQLWLYVYAADSSGDIKITCTGPSGSTVLWSPGQVILLPDAAQTAGTVQTGGTTAGYFVDANQRLITLFGSILNSTNAGDLQLQWAQNSSSATATTVKAGSYIYGTKVA